MSRSWATPPGAAELGDASGCRATPPRAAERTAVRRCRTDLRARLSGEDGSSVIEFLGLSLILLIPLVYLVLTLGRVEAATFATEGAAREAARTYVAADSAEEGAERAVAAVGIALRDQGFDDDPATALTLTCSAVPCLAPGSDVSARIEVRVPLPFVPGFVRDVVPLEVPVSVERVAPVDTYRTTDD